MRRPSIPVAIVGVSGVFPSSPNPRAFWSHILEGRDLTTDVPATHWLIEDYHDPDPSAPDKIYTARGAFLPPVDIDPVEFGIPPTSFPSTDTTQLLALLMARDVLHDATAGDLSRLNRERVSVILGVTAGQKLYVEMSNRLQRPMWVKGLRESGVPESEVQAICDRIAACYVPWTESTFPGSLGNVVAGRICNRFDLGGANFITDAACASSLAAVSMALDQLYLQQADMVITGGADTFNDPSMYMCFSKTPALSRSGRCRPFDAEADGTLLGEGVAFFALKRLADAERDGDRIYAVIHSAAGASDGRALSVYAPRAEGQARAMRRAYEDAGFTASSVELVEAHGTGTRAGDAAEFAGLKTVHEESGRVDRQWCALGSIKSQVGHLKAAAGAASLFKAVMALRHGVLPPTAGVTTPNPRLDIANSPFYLNTEARPWIRDGAHPRRAAVSSFGFGGSNWHMLLEEYTGAGAKADRMRISPTELVLLCADTPEALIERCRETAAEAETSGSLRWLARRSQIDFAARPARVSVVAADEADLRTRLRQAADTIARAPRTSCALPGGTFYSWQAASGKVAFLFPGQGGQYTGMTADISIAFEIARDVWDRTAAVGSGHASLHDVVFPKPVFSEEERTAQRDRLDGTEWTQPAIGAASLVYHALLGHAGVRADVLAGHSFGEIAALCAAGVLNEADLLRAAARRGALMAASPAGAMLAVFANRADVDGYLSLWKLPRLVVANDNAPQQVVLSGAIESVDEAEGRLSAAGVRVRRLRVSTANHSPLIEEAARGFNETLASIAFAAPRVPVYSTTSADLFSADGDSIRRQLGDQTAAESRFDGRDVVNLASNNYLGLTTHPKLREAALAAVRTYGVGSGAVRTISGTMSLHMRLEERIAAFKNVEACVVFQSGFAANAGTVSAILGPEDHIVSDELNHASIIDGCRLSKAKIHVFPHKDAAAADRILQELASAPGRKLLITDGVFSMDGDIGPLPPLVEAAERHGAIMMVDDAHSSGVLGRAGRGTVDHFGLHGRVHIQVGTLSKAVGVLGGYVCGSRDLIEFLYHRARPFLFSTSHPPAVAAACLAAFDVLEAEPERIRSLWDNRNYWKAALAAEGFDTGLSETPIVPVMVGEARLAHELSRALFERGVLATGIGFPTVPQGRARVRTIVAATHTREQLDRALEAFRGAGKTLGII